LQRNLNVLYVEPNKLPEKRTIKNTLEDKQKLVNGLIEYTYLRDSNDVAIVCNEEGKILGLPPNRDIGHDVICGNFFIVGDDPELGEDRSLTEEQIKKYSKYFGKESIEKTNEKIQKIFNDDLYY
jgi:transposase